MPDPAVSSRFFTTAEIADDVAVMFRGKIVDVSALHVIIEISGTEQKIESFIDLMRPFGIVELVRTGRIAMVRGTPSHSAETYVRVA